MANQHDQCPSCNGSKDTRAAICLPCKRSQPPLDNSLVRLMSKVKKRDDTGCWEFTGCRLPKGYGRIQGNGEGVVLAHRLSYTIHVGAIPEGMLVCHSCDNPPCVNPEHLFVGTVKDNSEDSVKKGRNYIPTESPKTRNSAHWKSRLSTEQVASIRARREEPRKSLAAEFGTSPRYVSAIICGRKRKYV